MNDLHIPEFLIEGQDLTAITRSCGYQHTIVHRIEGDAFNSLGYIHCRQRGRRCRIRIGNSQNAFIGGRLGVYPVDTATISIQNQRTVLADIGNRIDLQCEAFIGVPIVYLEGGFVDEGNQYGELFFQPIETIADWIEFDVSRR